MKRKNRIDFANSTIGKWLPVFLWAVVIFGLSSIRQIVVSQFFIWDFIAKKTAHTLEYAILFALIFRATNRWSSSFILTMAYAISDEFHQSFVPGRSPTFYDLGFDLSGGNIAAYIIWKLKQVHKHKLER